MSVAAMKLFHFLLFVTWHSLHMATLNDQLMNIKQSHSHLSECDMNDPQISSNLGDLPPTDEIECSNNEKVALLHLRLVFTCDSTIHPFIRMTH